MEYRHLGGSGFKVPVLSLGTGTFGGTNEFFKGFGTSDVEEATRLVDVALDAGLNMFDSADVYSSGVAEEILGQAIKGRRDKVLISTKATFTFGPGPNDVGSSRFHLIEAVEGRPDDDRRGRRINLTLRPHGLQPLLLQMELDASEPPGSVHVFDIVQTETSSRRGGIRVGAVIVP